MTNQNICADLNEELVPVTRNIRKINGFQDFDPLRPSQISDKLRLFLDVCLQKKQSIRKDLDAAGFSCISCGKCCKRADDDNSVFILPTEIEKIEAKTGLDRKEFIMPLFPDFYGVSDDQTVSVNFSLFPDILKSVSDQIDGHGRIHTFGWMFRRLKNGTCIFLDETNKCKIYPVRPGLCRTYPFYFQGSAIEIGECEGIGTVLKTETDSAKELTGAIYERLENEHNDFLKTQAFLEKESKTIKYNTKEGLEKALENLSQGILNFVVYDGSGIYEADISIILIK
jgi:Predicted Fe-S-cluster oxidoreductase